MKQQDNINLGKRSWRDVIDIVSYKGIVKNIPFLVFIGLLSVLYIANSTKAIDLIREISNRGNELKEVRWQYLDVQSRLMFATSESQLIKKANELGMQPLDKPAFEIDLNKVNNRDSN